MEKYKNLCFQNCGPLDIKSRFSSIYSVANIIISSAVPFLILLVMNLLIIGTLRNRKKQFQEDSKVGTQEGVNRVQGNMKSHERQITIMLVLVSCALLVFTLPQYIRFTVYIFIDLRRNHFLFGEYIFANGFTNTWFYINNSANFLLYCISGRKFRQDLLQIFKCFQSTSQRNTSTSTCNTNN